MKGRRQFTSDEARDIRKMLAEKLGEDRRRQKSIRGRIRRIYGFYITDFAASGPFGPLDFDDLVRTGQISIGDSSVPGTLPAATQPALARTLPPSQSAQLPAAPRLSMQTTTKRTSSDEAYVIDLCDEILGHTALRQHRFSFLCGDSGTPLPVDAWYPSLNLVVEYRERQHTEAVTFFDRRRTVSGVSRGEQRRLYDQRRRDLLPQHGIRLVEVDFHHLAHGRSKRLLRNREADKLVLQSILSAHLTI